MNPNPMRYVATSKDEQAVQEIGRTQALVETVGQPTPKNHLPLRLATASSIIPIMTSHQRLKTTCRYDRAHHNLDSHPTYTLAGII